MTIYCLLAVVRAMIAQGDFVEALEAAKKAAISLPHCFYAHLMLGIVRAHGLQGVVEVKKKWGSNVFCFCHS